MSPKVRYQTSLACNALLAVAVGLLFLGQEGASPTNDLVAASSPSRATPPPDIASPPVTAIAEELISPPQYADGASPADRRKRMIDYLRARGVPNELLGRVARVDFEVEWDGRFEAHWGDVAAMAALQLEMNLTKDAAMRDALGEADFKQWDQAYMLWEAMSSPVDVDAAEGEALYGHKKALQRRMLELDRARLEGTMDEAQISEATDAAYAHFHEQMRTVLGEARYAKSQQVDEAFLADNFRHQIAKANPTDDQVRTLFQVETEWNRARMQVENEFANNTFSPDYVKRLKALDAARDQEFQRVLGADAFLTLQKHQDPAYTQMKKYEALWGLDGEKIDYVYTAMKQYHQHVEDYQLQILALQTQGQPVDPAAVRRHLQASAEQTQQALQARLGRESFERLQGNRVLRWATLAAPPSLTPTP